MSWSLTAAPSFFPGFPAWTDLERDIDRDLSRVQRLFSDVAQHARPDREGVHHRQPSYTYNEDETQAHIEVELPGVAKENVNISLHGDKLDISAKRFKTTLTASPVTDIPVDKGAQGGMQNGDKTAKAQQKMDTEITQDDTPDPSTGDTSAQESTPSVMYKLSVPIGNKYDLDKIGATMIGDGILSLIVPKKVEHTATPRVIEIGSA